MLWADCNKEETAWKWGVDGSSRLGFTLADISEFSRWNNSRNASERALNAWRRSLSNTMWLRLYDAEGLAVGAFYLSWAFTTFRNPSTGLSVQFFPFCFVIGSTGFSLCWRASTPLLLAVVVAEPGRVVADAGGVVVGRCCCEGTSMSLLVKRQYCSPVVEQTLESDRRGPHQHWQVMWTLSKRVHHTDRWHTWWSKQLRWRSQFLPTSDTSLITCDTLIRRCLSLSPAYLTGRFAKRENTLVLVAVQSATKTRLWDRCL